MIIMFGIDHLSIYVYHTIFRITLKRPSVPNPFVITPKLSQKNIGFNTNLSLLYPNLQENLAKPSPQNHIPSLPQAKARAEWRACPR